MTTANINDHKITYYSDIDDTPIGRYNAFGMNLLYDASVGSSMEAIMERFHGLDAHLAEGNVRNAQIERNNLQITFYSMLKGENFAARALVCLLYSIDDELITDLSEGGMETTLQKLVDMEIPISKLRDIVFGQKKN